MVSTLLKKSICFVVFVSGYYGVHNKVRLNPCPLTPRIWSFLSRVKKVNYRGLKPAVSDLLA